MPPSPLPSNVNKTFLVGDSRTIRLADIRVDGQVIPLSDATRFRLLSSIKPDRALDTPAAATLPVTVIDDETVQARLTPDQAVLLGPLLADAVPEENTTELTALAAFDLQVEVLEDGEVIDRTTLILDDITISGDVTR